MAGSGGSQGDAAARHDRAGPDPGHREAAVLRTALLQRRAGYVPRWTPTDEGPDAALLEIVARYAEAVGRRLDQAPENLRLALLDRAGLRLVPAQPARVPVVFVLAEQATDVRLTAGTRLAAPPPSERSDQILFETERAVGLAAARLVDVLSLWPGRDGYVDHAAALRDGQPIRPFVRADLHSTPHHLYLAHDTLLKLAGESRLAVDVELTAPSGEHLAIVWEYWDGVVWRGFAANTPDGAESAGSAPTVARALTGSRAPTDPRAPSDSRLQDGTDGLRRSGSIRLEADCAEGQKVAVNGIEAFWLRGRLAEPLLVEPNVPLPEVEQVRVSTVVERPLVPAPDDAPAGVPKVQGFLPDQAFANGDAVDLTKPFFPFGQQPMPGSAFYLASEDALSRPGARLQLYLERTRTPQDEVAAASGLASSTTPLPHDLIWEYWNGRAWVPVPGLQPPANETMPDRPDRAVTVELTVPKDLAPTTVNEQEGRWLRVRLASGGFGVTQRVTWQDPSTKKTNELAFVIPQPPSLGTLQLGYAWQHGPFHPERVLAYNDFQYIDRTDEAIWPGRTFRPFTPLADTTPALYLGFDRALPVDRLGIFFDVAEDPNETTGPALRWEYWDGLAWQTVAVDDETRGLRVPGIVGLIGPEGGQPRPRFGTDRHWLRARLAEDRPPGTPTLRGIYPNAVWATQRETVVDEPVGTSTGQSDQRFRLRQAPILPGEEVEVRELSGPRANVEWRLLAAERAGGDRRAVEALERALAGPEPDVRHGGLRIRRDARHRVSEVWVTWDGREHLLRSGPNDRHYVPDSARGLLTFGDGRRGKIPPPGAEIRARRYQTGGGRAGNVGVRAISQLLGAGVATDMVFNPVPAEGGADVETLERLAKRGPRTLRHRGRGVLASDLETLAREASPAVAWARALAGRSPAGRPAPGQVTLLVMPWTDAPRPAPSFGLREQVRRFVEERAAADVAATGRLHVAGPSFRPVDVRATVVPRDPSEAGAVERGVREAIARHLHPLVGGPDGRGWEPGRGVFVSDMASLLERVPGVDHVEEVTLRLDAVGRGDHVAVPADRIVVAGEIHVRVRQA